MLSRIKRVKLAGKRYRCSRMLHYSFQPVITAEAVNSYGVIPQKLQFTFARFELRSSSI